MVIEWYDKEKKTLGYIILEFAALPLGDWIIVIGSSSNMPIKRKWSTISQYTTDQAAGSSKL